MADQYYPRPSKVDMNNPLQGFQAAQPPQVFPTSNIVKSGQDLLNGNAPGKLNENRFTSLKPSHNDK